MHTLLVFTSTRPRADAVTRRNSLVSITQSGLAKGRVSVDELDRIMRRAISSCFEPTPSGHKKASRKTYSTPTIIVGDRGPVIAPERDYPDTYQFDSMSSGFF